MKNTLPQQGFTLVELLITLAIVLIITSLAIPSFSSLISSSQKKDVTSSLIHLINLARTTAISDHTYVTICPLDDNDKCVKDWSRPIYAFEDPTKAGRLTSDASIIRVLDLGDKGNLIGKTGIHRYFRFNASGMVEGTLGNLTWCNRDLDPGSAMQIRINLGGRPKLARDNDNDGVVEDAQGNPVSCA